jgi:hypothetical protein
MNALLDLSACFFLNQSIHVVSMTFLRSVNRMGLGNFKVCVISLVFDSSRVLKIEDILTLGIALNCLLR